MTFSVNLVIFLILAICIVLTIKVVTILISNSELSPPIDDQELLLNEKDYSNERYENYK